MKALHVLLVDTSKAQSHLLRNTDWTPMGSLYTCYKPVLSVHWRPLAEESITVDLNRDLHPTFFALRLLQPWIQLPVSVALFLHWFGGG